MKKCYPWIQVGYLVQCKTKIQNWMLSQSDLVVADNIELVTELHACHKSIGGDLTLDDFMGTANVMLSDFNELDLQMADAKSFFRNLELLQSMKTYGMLVADNGSNWFVSGAPDARWNNDMLVSELGSVKGASFEVVRMDGLVTP